MRDVSKGSYYAHHMSKNRLHSTLFVVKSLITKYVANTFRDRLQFAGEFHKLPTIFVHKCRK